jgi:hypothetical protein
MTLGGRGVGVFVAGLVAALVTALLAVVLPMSAARAAPALVVFPDAHDINPKATPYSITIDDPGAVANLVARWDVAEADYREMALPHSGEVVLPFVETFAHNFTTVVTVYRCVNATWSADSCIELAVSPWTKVWVEASIGTSTMLPVSPTPQTVTFTYQPPGLGTSTWRLLAADGSELLAGKTALGPGGELAIAVPPGTAEQVGTLEVVSSVDGTVVGHLDGRASLGVQLDGVPPPTPTISVSASVVYPHRDGYLDSIAVMLSAPGSVYSDLEAVNETTGAVYRVHRAYAAKAPYKVSFEGWSSTQQRIPAGVYRLRVVATDWGGQSFSVSDPIEVRWDRLAMRTWRVTIPAAKTVIKKNVGSCGTLRKPAEPGWRGSLGYYSGSCRDSAKSVVQVIHGAVIPTSFNGKYDNFRVSLTGGPNKRQPRSYLVLGYYTNAKKWQFEHRQEFLGRRVQLHKGDLVRTQELKSYVHTDGKAPYVAWSTGLASGSRYDVKSFTVQISYQALVPEGQ